MFRATLIDGEPVQLGVWEGPQFRLLFYAEVVQSGDGKICEDSSGKKMLNAAALTNAERPLRSSQLTLFQSIAKSHQVCG